MHDLPLFVPATFVLAILIAVYCFYQASNNRIFLFIALGWLAVQAVLALTGFYVNEGTIPPRISLAIMPAVIPLLTMFRFRKGRHFLDDLDLRWLTLLHVARLPMGLVLFWLYQAGDVPRKLTFVGGNGDILVGLTAPLMAWLAFGPEGALRRPKLLLGWNLVSLAFLLILAATTLASIPTTMQALSFQRPMVGILYFPYIWMPSGIFPLIFIAQLVVLRRSGTNQNLKAASEPY